jgi:hypothetical protein
MGALRLIKLGLLRIVAMIAFFAFCHWLFREDT